MTATIILALGVGVGHLLLRAVMGRPITRSIVKVTLLAVAFTIALALTIHFVSSVAR